MGRRTIITCDLCGEDLPREPKDMFESLSLPNDPASRRVATLYLVHADFYMVSEYHYRNHGADPKNCDLCPRCQKKAMQAAV